MTYTRRKSFSSFYNYTLLCFSATSKFLLKGLELNEDVGQWIQKNFAENRIDGSLMLAIYFFTRYM